LTPVLPLLTRISNLERSISSLESQFNLLRSERPGAQLLPAPAFSGSGTAFAAGRRRIWPLPVGFAALLLAYATVVLWLDLPLTVLRLSSMAIPLATGFAYLGYRPRLAWMDVTVSILFSMLSVFSMNLILGWVDSIPVLPQGTAAWRETMYYTLSIGASMLSGMFLRMLFVAMAVRGLTSLPRLRQGLLTMNKSMPLDTLKAIELTVLLIGTLLSAITGLFAGIAGLSG
jgi:hypothetical protein